jgi:aminotransferase
MLAELNRRRDRMIEGLAEIDGLSFVRPQGALYVFPIVPTASMSSVEFANYLLDDVAVAVVPGSAFGSAGEGFFRVAFCSPVEVLDEAVRRIKDACRRLGRGRGNLQASGLSHRE